MIISCYVCHLRADISHMEGWGAIPYREDAAVYFCGKCRQKFVERNAERYKALTEANQKHRDEWIDPYYQGSWDLLDELAGEQKEDNVVKFPKGET